MLKTWLINLLAKWATTKVQLPEGLFQWIGNENQKGNRNKKRGNKYLKLS